MFVCSSQEDLDFDKHGDSVCEVAHQGQPFSWDQILECESGGWAAWSCIGENPQFNSLFPSAGRFGVAGCRGIIVEPTLPQNVSVPALSSMMRFGDIYPDI